MGECFKFEIGTLAGHNNAEGSNSAGQPVGRGWSQLAVCFSATATVGTTTKTTKQAKTLG